MNRSPALPVAPVALLCLALSAPLTGHAAEPCTPVFSISDCAGYLEAELIRKHPDLFSRKEGTLKLQLANGRAHQFKDIPPNAANDNDAQQVSYSLIQFFPEISYVMVDAAYWEGGTYYLLDLKTGVTTEVGGEVVLSPDKSRFAVANVDLEAGFTDNMLAVYRVTADGLVNEFLESPEEWGASDVAWEGNNAVRFARNYWGDSDIQKKTQRLRLVSTKPAPVWQLD